MKTFKSLRALIGLGKAAEDAAVESDKLGEAITATMSESDFLDEAAREMNRVTGMDVDEARFILDQVVLMDGDLQLLDGKIIVDLPPGKHDEIIDFQKALDLRHHQTRPASQLTNYDIEELQEAARQGSAMMGISEKQAMLRLMEIGRRTGKIGHFVKPPRSRTHDVKSCLQCGKDKQHANDFCSGVCAKQYKKESVVKDRVGRTIRPGMTVEIMEGGDEGKLLTVAEVLPDSPCVNQPGHWVDCRDIGEDVLVSGIMSYMLEIYDGETVADSAE